jgi:hypothetical protein
MGIAAPDDEYHPMPRVVTVRQSRHDHTFRLDNTGLTMSQIIISAYSLGLVTYHKDEYARFQN